MSQGISMFQIRIPEEFNQRIKVAAFEEGVSKHSFIISAVNTRLSRHETIKGKGEKVNDGE